MRPSSEWLCSRFKYSACDLSWPRPLWHRVVWQSEVLLFTCSCCRCCYACWLPIKTKAERGRRQQAQLEICIRGVEAKAGGVTTELRLSSIYIHTINVYRAIAIAQVGNVLCVRECATMRETCEHKICKEVKDWLWDTLQRQLHMIA